MQFENYLLSGLESFLIKGYFPSWLNREEISLEQIINSLIKSSQNDLKQMIKKHSTNESVIARLKHNLDLKTFEKIYSELESISLEVTQKLSIEDKLQQESNISYKIIDFYRRNIVTHYLDFGLLPKGHSDLNQIDVQYIFKELIQLKDSFLADKIHKSNNHKTLFNRIRLLLADDTHQDLNDYIRYYFSNADEYLREISSGFQKDIITESAKLEIEDLKSSTYIDISILAFYSHNEFFPWWTDAKLLSELLKTILGKSQSLGRSFEDICLQIESQSKFMEPLILILPAKFINVFSLFLSRHSRLNLKWKKSLVVTESANEENQSGTNKKIMKPSFKSLIESTPLELENDLNNKQLQKALYFLKDEEILNQLLIEKGVIKNQLLSYLKLAPHIYYQDITPSKWRKLVCKFAIDEYKSITYKPNKKLHVSFLEFLEKNNDNISWKEVFKVVYQRLKREDVINKVLFPKEFLSLIGKHPEHEKTLNTESSARNEDILDDIGEEIKIYNSGLILFWPFFKRFFEQLSLVINGEFVNEVSRNRAVLLLQYLTNNRIDFPEYELVLNKLLVGLPLERPSSRITDLTKDEKELCKSLLNGLMANWDKVESSTIEAIQETFLQREGILLIEENGVTLKIEKKGVDVLLNSLSWNITLVKLTWMQKPMYVEWI